MTEWSEVEETNLRTVAEVLTHWNRQDVNGVLDFYDEGIVWTNHALEEEYHGKDEVGVFVQKLMTAFPDLHFSVSERIAHENHVAETWEIRGTHLGPFLSIPATGRPVVIPGMSMVEMRNGKFYRDNFQFDSVGVLRQMGLMPSTAAIQTLPARAILWAAVNRVPVAAVAGLGAAALFLARKARSR
ncbi:MAG TPA: ester cyclase [Nitrolancea sp.]|nr:ester cyclase [Nitrolancea sp.]